MMVMAHNLLAMNGERMLGINTKAKAKSTEKLSSGYRINRSADDAAGLAMSEKMRRQVRGLTQGVQNTQEGVSFLQVADGALNEVHDMLHRITELTVKAANDTCSNEDREYIQGEINQLLTEIDRIGDTTTFNERPVFRGMDIDIYEENGSPIISGDIPYTGFQLSSVDLGRAPFSQNSSVMELNLQAIVENGTSNANGTSYDLVYGKGMTSYSSLRLTSLNGSEETKIIKLDDSNFTVSSFSASEGRWDRRLKYKDDTGLEFSIRQTVTTREETDGKFYDICYNFDPYAVGGTTPLRDYDVDFLFNVDTAYGGGYQGDHRESYYIDGAKVEQNTVYSKSGNSILKDEDVMNVSNVAVGDTPDSFSIFGTCTGSDSNNLHFSEKICFNRTEPDVVSIGRYNQVDKWSRYDKDSIGSLSGSTMRNSSESTDLAFSAIWNLDTWGDEVGAFVMFSYGIVPTESDSNLAGIPITYSQNIVQRHVSAQELWIHSGVEAGDGLWISVNEMNRNVLGLNNLDVTTRNGADTALEKVKGALKEVSENRSHCGAQQNRLEHIINHESNTVENTTAAESRIRDTDMAKEMVAFSNQSIIQQAGQTMLAQANQSKQGVLSLLS